MTEDAPDDGSFRLTKGYAKLEELMPLITRYQGTGTISASCM